jgi:hypothetical protein
MKTKVIKRNDYVSSTDPSDPDAVPAFENSAGIKPKDSGRRTKPVVVNKHALANFNANVDPVVQKNQLEAANVAALFAKRAIRPDEIAALRRRMFEVVAKGLDDVQEVIAGKKEWNNVQVRLFGMLTERVMPKLSSITVEDNTSKKLEDLSIEELEALALGKKNHEAIDAVIKSGQALDIEAEEFEKRSAGPKLAKLKHIASIDEAEKVVAKKVRAPKKEGLRLKK